METVEVHEAETHLSRFVDRAAAGAEIVIAKCGRPLARLVSIARPTGRRRLGLLKGLVRVSENFDAPLRDGASKFGNANH